MSGIYANNSYVKLFRKLTNWEWYKNNNVKALFLHCLIKANYQDGKFQGYDVPKGSFITSEQHLSEETGMTRQVIRTSLKNLEKSQEITKKVTNKFTLISVNNWEQYQGCIDEDNQQVKQQLTNNQPTTNQQLTTIKEIKEYKNNKNIKKEIYKEKKEKHKYGEYQNILLTDEEYNKLFQDYSNAQELIAYLDEYIEMKGYKAKSHYLAIKKWVVDAVVRENKKPKEEITYNPFLKMLMEEEHGTH